MADELEDTFFRVLTHMLPDAEAWRLPESAGDTSLILTEGSDFLIAENDDIFEA